MRAVVRASAFACACVYLECACSHFATYREQSGAEHFVLAMDYDERDAVCVRTSHGRVSSKLMNTTHNSSSFGFVVQ